MTRLNVKEAKKLGVNLELGEIRRQKQEQGVSVFAQKKMSEAEVLIQVRAYLEATGWLVMRIHQSLGSKPGLPDLICLKDGKTIYIECKSQRSRAKLSGAQEIMRQEIQAHGGVYIVAKEIEDIEAVINEEVE